MAPFEPARIDTVVFDVVGTLVDERPTWAGAARRLARVIGAGEAGGIEAAWAAALERRMRAVIEGRESWRAHRQLVVDSAREVVARTGRDATQDETSWAGALDSAHRAWPDVSPATTLLRKSRLVAALSNNDLDALARLANTNDIRWDLALSAGTAGTFKPAPAAYRYAIDALRLDPERTLFVAAHPWDLRAASAHGFRTAYVARPAAARPCAADRFDLAVDDLSELAAVLL